MISLSGLPAPPFTPERVYRGLPVPYTIHWPKGADKPDFTTLDPVRHERAVTLDLCGICGKGFKNKKRVWIAGFHEPNPTDAWFLDAPMHERCARYSARACPYLRHERIREDTPANVMPDSGEMALYFGEGVVKQGVYTRPRKFTKVERVNHDT